jgi:hypothetical protein
MLISIGNFVPQLQSQATSNCQDIGHLVHHMLTKQPKILATQRPQQNMLQLNSSGYYINNTDSIFSVCVIDFLEKCMSMSGNLQQLIGVSASTYIWCHYTEAS